MVINCRCMNNTASSDILHVGNLHNMYFLLLIFSYIFTILSSMSFNMYYFLILGMPTSTFQSTSLGGRSCDVTNQGWPRLQIRPSTLQTSGEHNCIDYLVALLFILTLCQFCNLTTIR